MKSPLHDLFRLCFHQEEGALIDGQMGLLHAASRCPAQVGQWALAVQTMRAYFRLEPGDLLLVKDPSAGGPGRDGMTLLQRLHGSGDLELYHARNFTAPSTWGQRLPPVPLRSHGEMNQLIVSAIGDDGPRLLWAIERQDEFAERWRRGLKHWAITVKSIKAHLDELKQDLKARLHEIPEGDAMTEGMTRFEETLRLRLISQDSRLHIEANGCSQGRKLWIPLPAAAAALRGAVMEWFDWNASWDPSLEEFMPFRCPQQVLLNARSQDPCDEGMEELPGLLRQLVMRAMQDLDSKRAKEGLPAPDMSVHLHFSGGRGWRMNLPSNKALGPLDEGIPHLLPQVSGTDLCLEEIENKIPVRVVRVGERTFQAAPVGEGKRHRGLVVVVELLEDARVRWAGGDFARPPKPRPQQRAAIAGEVALLDNEKALIPGAFHELKKGTRLQILSGAHGFTL